MYRTPLFQRRSLWIAIVVMLAILLVTILLTLLLGSRYVVYADDDVTFVRGDYSEVTQVLDAAGIAVRPEDLISPRAGEPIEPGNAITVERARPVTIRTESQTRQFWTLQGNLAAVLAEAGLSVDPTDRIFADGERIPYQRLAQATVPAVVEVGEFNDVTIRDGTSTISLRTAATTVGQAIEEAGLLIYAADGVQPALGARLTEGEDIVVRRSRPYTIIVDGQSFQTRSHHRRVIDILAEAGIGLVGQDFTVPPLDAQLQADATIRVVRVTTDYVFEDETIPYETLWQPTAELEIDQKAQLSAGTPGILRRRIEIRYEDGVEVSRRAEGEWVAREPVNQVMGYGTKIVLRTLTTPDGTFEYWRAVRMRVTSYTAASSGKAPSHPAYGITASGLQAGTGIVAIDPRVVPFRSWVYVPGYGTGFAGDTGGGVKGRWIDLGFDESEYESWSGYVDVYYLAPAPPPEKINYLIPSTVP